MVTVGGSSDTDVKELTVIPWKIPSCWVETIVMPVAQWRIEKRNWSERFGCILTSSYINFFEFNLQKSRYFFSKSIKLIIIIHVDRRAVKRGAKFLPNMEMSILNPEVAKNNTSHENKKCSLPYPKTLAFHARLRYHELEKHHGFTRIKR